MKQTANKLAKLFLVFALMTSPSLSHAQNVQVKGKIFDASTSKPIDGASILIKNSKTGNSSNAEGEFSISINKGEKLTISNVGFESQTIAATNDFFTIQLNPLKNQLGEVVVTAMGVKKYLNQLGYSLQTVKGSDLIKAREVNPINGLVGKVAGLDVAISQEMLAAPAVSLRGQNISLYVVDGIPVTSDTWNFSPDDVETYTVLKGLAATAIYGSRAQNGAIVITTKKGKRSNKGYTIELNSTTQFNSGFIALPHTQTLYGGGERTQYSFVDGKGGGVNDGDYDVWGPKFEGQLIAQYDSPIDPVTGKRIPTPYTARGVNNLQNFIQTGLLLTNNLSFSTASDKGGIRMSFTNTYQQGIIPNTKLNIYNFNINTSYNLSDKITVEGNLNYNRQATPNIPDVAYGPNSVIYSMTVWTGADWSVNDPNIINYWQPGKEGIQSTFAEYQRYQNPYFMSYEWLRGHYKTDIYGSFALTYKATKHIEAILRANVSTNNVLRTESLPYSAHPYGRELNRGDYREDRRSLFDNNIEGLVKYNGTINGGIVINAFAGVNANNFAYNSSYTTTDYLNVPGLYSFANSLYAIKAYSFNSNMLVLSGYYALQVDFNKYFNFGTTGRVDKNSTLLLNNNVYFYPSFSGATIVSDYVRLPKAISLLKFRGSYAQAKSPSTSAYIGTAAGAAYPIGYGTQYTTNYGGPVYNLSDPAYNITTVYNNGTGANSPDNSIDPNIKSSVLTSTELGMDIKFLQNRIGFGITVYNNIKGPGIRNYPISQTAGITAYTTNAVKTQTKGAEIVLNATPVLKNNGLRWDVLVNWSTFTETYKELPANFENYQFHQGDRVDKLYAGVTAKTADGQVINNSAGYPIYLPKAQYVGNGDENWSWAVINKVSYKNLSVSFQFDGKVGGIVQDRVMRKGIEGGSNIATVQGAVGVAREYEFNHINDPDFKGSYVGEGVQVANGATIQYDAVTGVITNLDALKFKNNDAKILYIQDYVSSFFNNFENTSVAKTYGKLRELIFTYTLPQSLLGKGSFITRIDISLVGRNLLYFFPSRFKDMDVDQYSGRDIYSNNSTEYNLQTPTTRSYGFNVNFVF